MIVLHILVISLLLIWSGLLFKLIFFQYRKYNELWKKHKELKSICKKIVKIKQATASWTYIVEETLKISLKLKKFLEKEERNESKKS